jgi:hypothetical protein
VADGKRSAFGWQAKALAPLLFVALIAAPLTYAAKLTPQAAAAFDRYIELAEVRMKADWKANAGGRLHGKKIDVPDGMIQDWVGAMFIPGANLAQVKAALQDYGNYKKFYKPEVIESRQVSHKGDEFEVFLRLYKKQVLTVILNSNYHVRYDTPDPHHMYVISHSTRIAEVKDADHPDASEEHVGDDTGFLWRLNSYWRFEQADGGVYAECEAISLSRDVPPLLGWMIKGLLEKFPKESMQNTLRGTKAAVMEKLR